VTEHLVVVDRKADFRWEAPGRAVVTGREFVTSSPRDLPPAQRVINLCRDYSYLSLGYYVSLLAEARGQRVVPPVEVMLDLHWRRLLRIALPEVSELVRRSYASRAGEEEKRRIVNLYFSIPDDPRLGEAATRIFDLFRCPLLAVELVPRADRRSWDVASIEPRSIRELKAEEIPLFADALDRYTRARWRQRRQSRQARWWIAILHDPDEKLPPSDRRALKKFINIGRDMGVDLELLTRADYRQLVEYDALFIRETTALDHHTYRFARKAESEGMPVIDDPASILRCSNKIYLADLLRANKIATPPTLVVDRRGLGRVVRDIGFPVVIKVPDGSFSRGVVLAHNQKELKAAADKAFGESDLIIAQAFMRTDFDWRVGIIDREPLFVCQYDMAPGHWQIVKHSASGRYTEGTFRAFPVAAAPWAVVETAIKAANLIGDGLYGVDLKETSDGEVVVVEVNDNPNIEAGVEDSILGDDLYRRIIGSFVRRLEKRASGVPKPAVGTNGR
jgi:glutathione synthase/RimK-type ligase-like ATP-grasp enzyme